MIEDASALAQILQTGGSMAVAAIAIGAWYYERRQNQGMQTALLDLAKAQIASSLKLEITLDSVKTIVSALSRSP
jgi:hypothetical protein